MSSPNSILKLWLQGHIAGLNKLALEAKEAYELLENKNTLHANRIAIMVNAHREAAAVYVRRIDQLDTLKRKDKRKDGKEMGRFA